VGKRSRKRMAAGEAARAAGATRAQRDEARRQRATAAASPKDRRSRHSELSRGRRPTIDERPPAPWGTFPLSELLVFIALVLCVAGVIVWGDKGRVMLAAGAALGSLAGLELSIREHFAGYRSHSTLLAAATAVATAAVAFFILGGGRTGAVAFMVVLALVFAGAFWLLRGVFRQRSGGLSFR
jgi:hypothetical protein